MTKKMKVLVPLVIEIDAEAWDRAFGTGLSTIDIREDVRSYFLNLTSQAQVMDEVDGYAELM